MRTRRTTPTTAAGALPALGTALVVALLLAGCGGSADDGPATGDTAETSSETPSETSSESPGEATGGTAELTVVESQARCAMPTADFLSGFDTAFSGTVTSLEDGVATLEVEEWYAGEQEAGTVEVAAPDRDLAQLLLAVDFEVGTTYLVSAQDGQVSLCGFSGELTPELAALYAEAFGRPE